MLNRSQGFKCSGWLWLSSAILIGACGSQKAEPKAYDAGQSLEQAMTLVCHVDEHIGGAADDPLEREQRRSDFIEDKIKNPDVIYHRTLWRVQSNQERAKSIRDLSVQAKLPDCPYAEALEQEE